MDAKPADPLELLDELKDYRELHEEMTRLGRRIATRRNEHRVLSGMVGNYILAGPPGTGKSTVARVMGKLLHAYGVLVRDHVEETSAMGLMGQAEGQSIRRVEDKMNAARGGVLFIDEAYGSAFAQAAVQQLLTMMTQPEFVDGKTVVILAGHRDGLEQLLSQNMGLRSRFRRVMQFEGWDAQRCSEFVIDRLGRPKEGEACIQIRMEEAEQCRSVLLDGFRR